jgi:hypothetical protein
VGIAIFDNLRFVQRTYWIIYFSNNKYPNMKKLIYVLICIMSLAQDSAAQVKFKKMLGKKDLEQWLLPDDKGCYTINKGMLTIKSEPTKKGSILWTKKHYKNFVIKADFKMGDGVVDSGIFLRSETNQIQIGISGSLKRDMTGSPYIPKLRYPVEAKGVKELLKQNDWNHMEVKLVDKTYTVWLNGIEVMSYTTDDIPEMGPVGLQLHPNNEMTIYYKKVEIAEL